MTSNFCEQQQKLHIVHLKVQRSHLIFQRRHTALAEFLPLHLSKWSKTHDAASLMVISLTLISVHISCGQCSSLQSLQFFPAASYLSCLPQTLTSAPSRGPATTPASTTPAALSACATRATSCMASRTVEVRACSVHRGNTPNLLFETAEVCVTENVWARVHASEREMLFRVWSWGVTDCRRLLQKSTLTPQFPWITPPCVHNVCLCACTVMLT